MFKPGTLNFPKSKIIKTSQILQNKPPLTAGDDLFEVQILKLRNKTFKFYQAFICIAAQYG